MKNEEKVLYTTIVDFTKEVILPEDARIIYSDNEVLKDFSFDNLKMLKNEYLEKLKSIEKRINSIYFRIEKSKQKVCVLSQKEQEILRSKYWCVKKMVKRIDYLIGLDKILNFKIDKKGV